MFESCKIRAMTHDDLIMVLEWRNNPDIRRFMFTQHEITLDEHQKWFEKATSDPKRRLLIVEAGSAPIGYVQFSNVISQGVADWGFYARPDAPKGSGRKLGSMALDYAFDEMNLHKVCGQAIEINYASIAFHKRLGFIQEGMLRDQQCIDGVYHTLVCFGLLSREWQPEKIFQE